MVDKLDCWKFPRALALMDSDDKGESQAAFAACDRIRRAAGMTWVEAINHGVVPPEPRRQQEA